MSVVGWAILRHYVATEIVKLFAVGLRKGALPRMGGAVDATDSLMVNRAW